MAKPGEYNMILCKFYTGFPNHPLMTEEEHAAFVKYFQQKEVGGFAREERDTNTIGSFGGGVLWPLQKTKCNPHYNNWPHYGDDWPELMDIFSLIKEIGQEDLDLTSQQLQEWNLYEGNINATFIGSRLDSHRIVASIAEFIEWFNTLDKDIDYVRSR